MKEIYVDKKDFEGLYQISNLANMKSSYRNCKILKPTFNRNGYLRVELRKDGERFMCFLHKAVAEAFIPNPLNKKQVNHKDGNKTNNSIDNLEWVTSSENALHAFKIGLRNNKGDNSPRKILNSLQVSEIRSQYKPHKITLQSLADKYGVKLRTIQAIIYNQNW